MDALWQIVIHMFSFQSVDEKEKQEQSVFTPDHIRGTKMVNKQS